jgi:hypothetical protein
MLNKIGFGLHKEIHKRLANPIKYSQPDAEYHH